MLPAAPRSGDGITARGASPSPARAAVTRSSTARWTAGSVTSPPRRTWLRPASNCGLISNTASAPSAATPASAGATSRREMNDRSATTRSTGSPTSARVRWRALRRSRTVTRGSLRSDQASWPVPTSTATTEAAPCCRRQSVNPPVEAPASSARRPATSTANRSSAATSFSPPRETKRAGGPSRWTGSSGDTSRPGRSARAPETSTSPASMASCARARDSVSPRRTSSRSSRRRMAL